MFKHKTKFLLTALIAVVISVAANASDLAVRLVEFDCYGNQVAAPNTSGSKDTHGLNCKSYGENRWSGPGVVQPTSWDSGRFNGITGTGTFAFTDRFNAKWSTQINVPSGYTLYVGYLNKNYNMMSLVTGTNNVAYTGTAFTVRVGTSNLDTLAKIMDANNTAYTWAYNMGGYSKSFLLPRIPDVGNNTSIYLIHPGTGVWVEFTYSSNGLGSGELWHIPHNVDYFLEYVNSLAATRSTTVSPSVGAKLSASDGKLDKTDMSKKIGKKLVKTPMESKVVIKAVEATADEIAAEKKAAEASAKKVKTIKK